MNAVTPGGPSGLRPENVLKLYEIACEEEKSFLEAHQNRVAFFAGLLSTVLAATLAGFFQAGAAYQLAGLLAGPVIIVALARLATGATERFYRRFLEVVTVKAKLQHQLGLLLPRDGQGKWWMDEPLVPTRHLTSRAENQSSDEFIKARLKSGYQASIIMFFELFKWVGILLVFGILARGLFLWLAPPA
jgi:hypothetical protein